MPSLDADEVAREIGDTLLDAGFNGLEQVVPDSEDAHMVFLAVFGEWFTVTVTKDAA